MHSPDELSVDASASPAPLLEQSRDYVAQSSSSHAVFSAYNNVSFICSLRHRQLAGGYVCQPKRAQLTASSASMAGSRSSADLSSARWLSSGLVRRSPALASRGAFCLRPSSQAIYSSREEHTHWKVDVTFHGFVEAYTRGESDKN
jgi:hypothetical protein